MDWTDPHFAEPQWLLLAVLGPLALMALQVWSARARKRQLALLVSAEFVGDLTRSHSPARRAIKNGLLALALATAGLAMARPQWGQLEDRGTALGHDVIFLLDCSRSMVATDVSPNRLERARFAILDFVQQHVQGRLGLVVFAGQAFLQCPLTYDYEAFRSALESVDEQTIAVPGTDIGRALQEAFRASENSKGPRIMILVTDGEDLEQSGVRVAESIGKQGAVVFTIGVGTQSGSELQVRNEQGRLEMVRDRNGQVVRSRLDEATLTKIAQSANGTYQPLGSVGEGLARVRAAIRTDAFRPAPVATRKLGIERFHYPLAAMIALLAVEALIGTRRGSRAKLETPTPSRQIAGVRALLLGLLALGAVLPPGSASAQEMEGMSAREAFNTGTARFRSGKLREAEGLLESLLTTQRPDWQVPGLYNLGHARFSQGMEELKKSEEAGPSAARGRATALAVEETITDAREALRANEVKEMVKAYVQGRGVRRDLRSAIRVVRQALQIHAAALERLQRASGDWKSAVELDPKNADARHNADVADRHIARVIDSIRDLQQSLMQMQGAGEELRQMMNQMKGKIPAEDMPPGAPGEDEEEEEDGGMLPPPGTEEGPGQEGREMQVSPEEASWLLEGFRASEDRRLPMTQGTSGEPRERNKPTW